MSMFNKLLGKKDEQAEPQEASITHDFNTSGGFLCPLCYLSFDNSDKLTTHFNNVHDEQSDTSSLNTSHSNNQSASSNDKNTLTRSSSRSSFNPKIESILKKYVSNSQNDNDEKSLTGNESVKNNLESQLQIWKEQLELSENTRLSLSSDLLQYQDENKKMASKIQKNNKEKQTINEKLARITLELNTKEVEVEKLRTENESVTKNSIMLQEEFVQKHQRMVELESELLERPTVDDLNLLKREIVQVQSLTDTIVKEKENQYNQLLRDHDDLKSDIENLRIKYQDQLKNEELAKKKENELRLQIDKHLHIVSEKSQEINELLLNVSQLNKEVESKNNRITNLEIETKELSEQHTELKVTIKDLEAKKASLTSKLNVANHKTNTTDSELQADYENLNNEKELVEAELTKAKVKNDIYYEEKLKWLSEKDEFLSMKQDFEKLNLELENKTKLSETEINKLIAEKAILTKIFDQNESEKTDLKTKTIAVEEDKKVLEKEISTLKTTHEDLTLKMKELSDYKVEVEKQNENLNREVLELNDQLHVQSQNFAAKEQNLLELNNEIEKLRESNRNLQLEKEYIIETNNVIETNNKMQADEIIDYKIKLNDSETKYSDLRSDLNRLNQEKDQLSSENENFKTQLDSYRTKYDDTLSCLNETEASFKDLELRNAELIKKIDELNNETSFLSTNLVGLKKIEIELGQVNESLSVKCEMLIKEIERVKIECDNSENLRIEAVEISDINMKALNQNLSNLRTEVKRQKDNLSQSEVVLNKIKGDNLEMEAKLSNCLDDRNQLLERCLISEKLCESMKTQNIELKRRFEDTQSALQELGREHQELQIQNYKKSNYKWVDDRNVSECTQCKKNFTVTIRKHHCRNCGQVYCNECSDHTATVSSSAKKQRVCKACFFEINNN